MLTVTFVGGGFTGVEGFGELLSLATSLLGRYPELSFDDLDFRLVEAQGRILPEVTDEPGAWVVSALEKRGARIHLNTQVVSAEDGHVVLSSGEEFDSELIVWTAGNAANPVVAHAHRPAGRRHEAWSWWVRTSASEEHNPRWPMPGRPATTPPFLI